MYCTYTILSTFGTIDIIRLDCYRRRRTQVRRHQITLPKSYHKTILVYLETATRFTRLGM